MKRKKINATAEELAQIYLQGATLQKIADMYGVSRERIRQILARAGYVIKDIKAGIKVQERIRNKVLAEQVLLESTEREIKKLWGRTRFAEHRLHCIKKSRIKLIDGFKETLFAIRELNNSPEIEKLIKDQLDEFSSYVLRMEGEQDEKNTEGNNQATFKSKGGQNPKRYIELGSIQEVRYNPTILNNPHFEA